MTDIKVRLYGGPFGGYLGDHILHAHGPELCKDDPACCIHKPSDHPLRHAPLQWRADLGLMERRCPHGIGHPDPDDLAFKKRTMDDYDDYAFGVHGCDGCCSAARSAAHSEDSTGA